MWTVPYNMKEYNRIQRPGQRRIYLIKKYTSHCLHIACIIWNIKLQISTRLSIRGRCRCPGVPGTRDRSGCRSSWHPRASPLRVPSSSSCRGLRPRLFLPFFERIRNKSKIKKKNRLSHTKITFFFYLKILREFFFAKKKNQIAIIVFFQY